MENTTTILKEMSEAFAGLDNKFRQILCWQCRWSEATYYRKRNGTSPISNSDKASINTLADEMKKELFNKIKKTQKDHE